MNSAFLINIFRFVLLLAVQILIFNNINLFGFLNPFPYVLFVILYPVNANRAGLLVASFLLGLSVDFFCNSGGVHAGAMLVLAFVRNSYFRFAFGVSYEYQTVRILDRLTPERFSYILISILTHHLILFIFEIFRFQFFWEILYRTFLTTIFTLVVSIAIIYIFKPNKR